VKLHARHVMRDVELIAWSCGECKVMVRVESSVLVAESLYELIGGNMLQLSLAAGVLSSQLVVSET